MSGRRRAHGDRVCALKPRGTARLACLWTRGPPLCAPFMNGLVAEDGFSGRFRRRAEGDRRLLVRTDRAVRCLHAESHKGGGGASWLETRLPSQWKWAEGPFGGLRGGGRVGVGRLGWEVGGIRGSDPNIWVSK